MSDWVDCKTGDWVRMRNGDVIHVAKIESHFGDSTGWGLREGQGDRTPRWFEPFDVVEVVRHEPFYEPSPEDLAAVAAFDAAVRRVHLAMPWLLDPGAWLRERMALRGDV